MILEFILDLLFPPQCLGCGKGLSKGSLCVPCKESIAIYSEVRCPQCGEAVRNCAAPPPCHPEMPCIIGSVGNYENTALRSLIHALKFRGMNSAAKPLGELLARFVNGLTKTNGALQNFAVVPIPLSKKRRRSRGFNQAELIGRSFVSRVPTYVMHTALLVRTEHRKPQSETESVAERRENIKGCYAIAPGAAFPETILLIDDVTTTGSTFLEAARVLKAAGARTIIAIAVARVDVTAARSAL